MKTLLIIFISLIVGVTLGQWSIERQFTREFEDGSFVGCKLGYECAD